MVVYIMPFYYKNKFTNKNTTKYNSELMAYCYDSTQKSIQKLIEKEETKKKLGKLSDCYKFTNKSTNN